jgi:hypothetical protein
MLDGRMLYFRGAGTIRQHVELIIKEIKARKR